MNSVSAKPPSRREARRLHRREAIIDVAAQSLLEHGYAATTMSAIAATLGGSKGTLWSYFPSKEVLFAEVLDQVTKDFRQELSLILNRDDPVSIALRRFCRQFLQKVTSPEAIALHRLVMGEANRFPEMGRIFYERAPLRTRDQLSEYLTAAMKRGLLRQADPRAAALQLTALCMAGSHQQLVVGVICEAEPERIEEDVDRAMDIFMRAYQP